MAKLISERKRHLFTGRAKGSTFLLLLHSVIDSPEFARLTGGEVKLLIDLARQYNGKNNGNFDTSQLRMRWTPDGRPARQGTAGMKPASFPGTRWNSESKVTRLVKKLVAKGWLILTKQGGLGLGPSLYAISWWPVDECKGKHDYPAERVASHLWRKKVSHLEQVRTTPKTSVTGESHLGAIAPETGAEKGIPNAA